MNINDKMKAFLAEESIYRRINIVIKFHTSGFRVILMADDREISFGVNSDIESAFDDALQYFKHNLKVREEEKIMQMRNRADNMAYELKELRARIKSEQK